MSPKHPLAILLLACTIAAFAALYFSGWFTSPAAPVQPPAAPPAAPAPKTDTESPSQETGSKNEPAQVPAAQSRQAPLPPLPDNSLPLSQQVQALLRRAEAGDTAAACRLIIGINRCAEQRRNQRYTERMVADLQAKSQKNERALINMAARMQEQSEGAGAFCAGLDSQTMPTADALLESSRGRMTARQKTLLVLMRSDGSLRRLQGPVSFSESGMYMIPQFVADHSVEFLQEGFAAKDPLALEGLILLHAPASTLGPSSVSVWLPNPRLFLRYSMLMHDLFGAEALGRRAYELSQQVAATIGAEEVEHLRSVVAADAAQWRNAAGKHSTLRQPRPGEGIDEASPCDSQ